MSSSRSIPVLDKKRTSSILIQILTYFININETINTFVIIWYSRAWSILSVNNVKIWKYIQTLVI